MVSFFGNVVHFRKLHKLAEHTNYLQFTVFYLNRKIFRLLTFLFEQPSKTPQKMIEICRPNFSQFSPLEAEIQIPKLGHFVWRNSIWLLTFVINYRQFLMQKHIFMYSLWYIYLKQIWIGELLTIIHGEFLATLYILCFIHQWKLKKKICLSTFLRRALY